MLLNDMTTLKPILVILILAGIVVVPPSLVLNYWHTRTRIVEDNMGLFTQMFSEEIIFGLKTKAELLSPLNSSTTTLARMLSAYVNDTKLSIPHIESEVAPLLFQAFSIIPYLSQVSYIRRDGLLFAYYNNGSQQPVAVYTNISLISVNEWSLEAKHNLTCYSQPANRNTGKLYEVITSHPCSTLLNPSMLQVIMESRNGTASVGPSWINNDDVLLLNTAVIDERGAISIGFQVKTIVQSLSGSVSNDGSLFFGTKDGQVLLNDVKIPKAHIVIVGNNSIAINLLNQNGDQVGDIAGYLTCQENDDILRPTTITISETKYDVYCSQVEILGLESVVVLAMPIQGQEIFMHKHFSESYRYLIGTICLMFLFTAIFVVLIVVASERVTHLRVALKKQVVATTKEERKGIEISTNYATASHDVRAALAGITGLIDICLTQVDCGSDLEANIIKMKTCSQDLLGILTNILDRSKLEAGKIMIEQEEFRMSQLLEDVADLFHSVGMKKGVDVVLDLSDGSVNKFDHVRGDRKKLKQILLNLVSNAVKFTSEGYVSIRAYARKPSSSSSIPNSTQKGHFSWLSCFYFLKNEAYTKYEMDVDDIQKDENCMEFIFEVDDTGVGIPKDKQETVFENYAQIKGTSAGQEGTGLGLGIVKTLVRLLGGKIDIVDKEVGKKGTCFKFNTYISICETDQRDQSDDVGSHVGAYMSADESFLTQSMQFSSPEKEGSLVIIFMQNEERRKVCQNFMEGKGIKVLAVRNYEELSSLKNMRHIRVLSQEMPSTHNMTSTCGSLLANFILIIIDTTGGMFHDLSKLVAEFRKNLSIDFHKVVWLDCYGTGNIHLQDLTEDRLPAIDIIMSKPLHGSRLYQTLQLLPEFGGEPSTSLPNPISSPSFASSLTLENEEIEEVGQPLSGKKVLVVEDDIMLRDIAKTVLSTLGATFEIAHNGQEALQTISKGLQERMMFERHDSLPFDYIFMDCQMPIMDGIEATRKIREEEAKYGVHIPIFAVSAHTEGPEIELMKEAGVDYNLAKPLNAPKLVEVLNIFEG